MPSFCARDRFFKCDMCPHTPQCFKPESVSLEDGKVLLQYDRNVTYDLTNKELNYRAARLQTWNKLCYTGGYLEVRLKQPGTASESGVRSAVRTMGNLGRAGMRVHCGGTRKSCVRRR